MLRDCQQCRKRYDDAECYTFCPHARFITAEDRGRKDLAFTLIGKPLCFAHQPNGEKVFVESIGHDGMVTLKGWTGEFAPHLFVLAA
jgi:hypothetical protein